MKEMYLNDIKVMYVAIDNMEKIKDAFRQLEAPMKSLRGRKFFGTYYKGIYKASSSIIEKDDPEAMGFKTEIIPGGKYLCEKMDGWQTKTNEIGPWFSAMASKYDVDDARPSIEFYRSTRELFLYLPLK